MQLKTVSSFGLAFLLVVGVVGLASAQEVATTPGIFIRVDKPAVNEWAKIGETVEIRIYCYDGRLAGGVRVAVVDSSVDDDEIGTGRNLENKVYFNEPFAISDGDAVFGDGANVDTFKISFDIVALENLETANSRSAKVVIVPLDEDPLNNLMTDKKIAPVSSGFGATRVGDGKLFGIDGHRPFHGDLFRSISLDLDAVSTDTTTDQTPGENLINRVMISTDNEVKVTLDLNTGNISLARADRIEIGIVPTDSISVRMERSEDALDQDAAEADAFQKATSVKLLLRGDKLYSPNPSVSREIEAGTFADNQRVEILAYFVDPAGNVGGTIPNAVAADWKDLHGTDGVLVSENLMIIADATAPTITIIHPHPDSVAAGSQDPLITANDRCRRCFSDRMQAPERRDGSGADRPPD